jgi:hypothetical protein
MSAIVLDRPYIPAPPDDPPFRPHNKIRGSEFESVVVELLYQRVKLRDIQERMNDAPYYFKFSYATLAIYYEQYYQRDMKDISGHTAYGIIRAESAVGVSKALKERAFTDMMSRVDQLRQDIRRIDAIIEDIDGKMTTDKDGKEEVNTTEAHTTLIADARQQAVLQRWIEKRNEMREKLNSEINNPQSFERMKLSIMQNVATKAILVYAPHVPPGMKRELLDKFKQEIRYL